MKKLEVRELSVESFMPFGFYANMINPEAESLGVSPIVFYRDMIQQDMGNCTMPSFSVCRVEKRPFVVDVSEFHNTTPEGSMPLDNDVIIHTAPANAAPYKFPAEKLQLFRVPKGTMVILRPGVWHHAAFTVNAKPANVLIVLPERVYAKDCHVLKLKKKITFSLY